MSHDDSLPFGLYERLITAGLKARLLRFNSSSVRIAKEEADPADSHLALARHIEALVAQTLRQVPEDQRLAHQSGIVNRIIELLAETSFSSGADDHVACSLLSTCERFNRSRMCRPRTSPLVAPLVPLSASDLLVNARGEPALAHALGTRDSHPRTRSTCSAPSFVGTAFVCSKTSSKRIAATGKDASRHHHGLHRLDRAASARLARRHGAEVKVSYDTQSTRLHAKAWMFRRETGFSTGLHRLFQPLEVRADRRRGMECAAVRGGFTRHPREVRRDVRQLLGEPGVRRLRSRRATPARFDRAVAPEREGTSDGAAVVP